MEAVQRCGPRGLCRSLVSVLELAVAQGNPGLPASVSTAVSLVKLWFSPHWHSQTLSKSTAPLGGP